MSSSRTLEPFFEGFGWDDEDEDDDEGSKEEREGDGEERWRGEWPGERSMVRILGEDF